MLAVALALGSGLAYGISDFLGGLTSRSTALLSVLLVSQGTALVLVSVVVILRGERPPGGAFLAYAALAGLGETLGVAALYRGLAVGTMSVVAPVGATAPVVPVAVGIALGEFPSPIQGAGIALAVAGIAVASWKRPSGDAAYARFAPSVLFGLLSALGFGGFFVFMDAASDGGVPWALLVARLTAVAVFVAAVLLGRAYPAVRGAELPRVALIGVLIVGADSMYAAASTRGLLGVVAALSSLYPLVTIGLARVYLRERIGRLQQVGIAACLSGVVAISGAAGDGRAGTEPHEAEHRGVPVVGVEDRLAQGGQIRPPRQAAGGGLASSGPQTALLRPIQNVPVTGGCEASVDEGGRVTQTGRLDGDDKGTGNRIHIVYMRFPYGPRNFGADLPYRTYEETGHRLRRYRPDEFNRMLDGTLTAAKNSRGGYGVR